MIEMNNVSAGLDYVDENGNAIGKVTRPLPTIEVPYTHPVGAPRFASCVYCGKREESSEKLPFFKERPNCETDSYYCGCYGWD